MTALSSETAGTTVRMPDLRRRPLTQAKTMLSLSGLRLGKIVYQESMEWLAEDTVLSHHPQPGQAAGAGQAVDLTLHRRSYLHYLPGMMQQEDQRAGGLLKNYLWIFQHLLAGFQDNINRLPDCFGPQTAPRAFLLWLAEWTAAEIDGDWPEAKVRRFLAQAVEIYNRRGTRRGLLQYLSVVTGVDAAIEEHTIPFKLMVLDGTNSLGVSSMLFNAPRLEHCFTVRLPGPRTAYARAVLRKMHRILQVEQPAQTLYFIAFTESRKTYQSLVPWIIGQTPLGQGWVGG